MDAIRSYETSVKLHERYNPEAVTLFWLIFNLREMKC
jgi:hypothetical protein